MLPSRRRGPFRQEWYSICSKHRGGGPDSDCRLCRTGQWHNVHRLKVSGFVHDHAYPVWFWWVNRPNSRSRKFLRSVFPNLR